MAALHLPPPGGVAGGVDGINPAGPPAPPGTDMTGICFRDQLWLNSFPLERNLVFDYFALSPFYDFSCINEKLRMQSIHPLDISNLSKLSGMEYTLSEVLEPHLFVIRKQKRDEPEKVTPMLTYYILDGSIYQAPQLSNVFASRIARALYHMSKAFSMASSKLEKIGNVDPEDDGASIDAKPVKELFDFKEVKRVDHILGSLLRKHRHRHRFLKAMLHLKPQRQRMEQKHKYCRMDCRRTLSLIRGQERDQGWTNETQFTFQRNSINKDIY